MNTAANTTSPRQTVYLVDDDDAMRDSLVWLLEGRGLTVRTYSSAEAFLAEWKPGLMRGCIVLDIRMPGMSGLELYEQLSSQPLSPPVIFVTGHGDIPMAVSALKKGAADFIEKPFNDKEIAALVEQCLEKDRAQRGERERKADIAQRLALLTAREHEVMEKIIAGRLNKQIADDLGISIKTVEVHRARVMEKMEANTVVELVQSVIAAREG
jgi:FixJ family two-component response regulator